MAEKFNFRINSRVRIFITRNGVVSSYLSIIQDVQEVMIGIDLPIQKSMYVDIASNEEVLVHVFDPTGLYEFSTRVVKIIKSHPPLIYLQKSAQIKKFENRQFPRLKTYLTVLYYINLSEGMILSPQISLKGQVYTRDISVGGGCLVMPFELPKGVILDLELEVPRIALHTYSILKIQSEVCRVQKDDFSNNYFVSIIFTRIAEDAREIIDQYISSSLM